MAEWSKALQLREKINENQKISGSPPQASAWTKKRTDAWIWTSKQTFFQLQNVFMCTTAKRMRHDQEVVSSNPSGFFPFPIPGWKENLGHFSDFLTNLLKFTRLLVLPVRRINPWLELNVFRNWFSCWFNLNFISLVIWVKVQTTVAGSLPNDNIRQDLEVSVTHKHTNTQTHKHTNTLFSLSHSHKTNSLSFRISHSL